LQAFADEEAELVAGVAIELLRQSNKQNNLNFVATEDQKTLAILPLVRYQLAWVVLAIS